MLFDCSHEELSNSEKVTLRICPLKKKKKKHVIQVRATDGSLRRCHRATNETGLMNVNINELAYSSIWLHVECHVGSAASGASAMLMGYFPCFNATNWGLAVASSSSFDLIPEKRCYLGPWRLIGASQQMEQEEKEAASLPVGRYKGVEEKATVLK